MCTSQEYTEVRDSSQRRCKVHVNPYKKPYSGAKMSKTLANSHTATSPSMSQTRVQLMDTTDARPVCMSINHRTILPLTKLMNLFISTAT